MTDIVDSNYIANLYIKHEKDENVFPLIDSAGINIIRKYKDDSIPAKQNYRMFIRLFVTTDYNIRGGVDVVKAPSDNQMLGYPLVYEEKNTLTNLFKRKYTNFSLSNDEEILFLKSTGKISFRNKNYSISEFVDLLVYNHNHDIFLISRINNLLKTFFIIEPAFYLADLNYRDAKTKFDFILKRNTKEVVDESKIEALMPTEPFFKYFRIYKRVLSISILILITPIFWLSVKLDTTYFTITNPFLLFLAFALFSFLDKFSISLYKNISNKKVGYLYKLAESTLSMKGKLKVP